MRKIPTQEEVKWRLPTYISLGRFTREGMMDIKKHPERLEQAKKAIEAAGGNLKEFYMTFGRFDFVAVSEGPNDEAALKAILMITSGGAVGLETLKAIPSAEAVELIKSLP